MKILKDPIFIVGLPRSGSTLLHNIISNHPSIYRVPEIIFLSPFKKDFNYFIKKYIGNLKSDDAIEDMVMKIFSNKNYGGITAAFWRFENDYLVITEEFKEQLTEQIKKSDRSNGAIFKILTESLTELCHYGRCCIKFPVYISKLPTAIKWCPNAKIIHLSRDPRAIAMSKTDDPSGSRLLNERYPILKPIIRKALIIFVTIQFLISCSIHKRYQYYKNYRLLKFEDLLKNKDEEIVRICDYIKLEYYNDLSNPSKGEHLHQPSSLTGKQIKGIDAKTADRWRKKITPLEKLFMEVILGKSMKIFGYSLK